MVIRDELDFSVAYMKSYAETVCDMYTTEQAEIHDKMIQAVKSKIGKCLFIKACGGCVQDIHPQ